MNASSLCWTVFARSEALIEDESILYLSCLCRSVRAKSFTYENNCIGQKFTSCLYLRASVSASRGTSRPLAVVRPRGAACLRLVGLSFCLSG